MTIYLSNAFSLSMLSSSNLSKKILVEIEEISEEEVEEILRNGFVSAVGHQATAEIISKILGVQVNVNRIEVKLEKSDVLVVFQLLQRLSEGKILSKEELEAIPHKWYKVTILRW